MKRIFCFIVVISTFFFINMSNVQAQTVSITERNSYVATGTVPELGLIVAWRINQFVTCEATILNASNRVIMERPSAGASITPRPTAAAGSGIVLERMYERADSGQNIFVQRNRWSGMPVIHDPNTLIYFSIRLNSPSNIIGVNSVTSRMTTAFSNNRAIILVNNTGAVEATVRR